MSNSKNLIPPKKGEVRNPKGRGKGTPNRATIARKIMSIIACFPEETYEELLEIYPDIKKRMSIEEMIMMVQANKAIAKEDTQAANFMMDNLYGKQSSVDVTTKGDSLNVGFAELMKQASKTEE